MYISTGVAEQCGQDGHRPTYTMYDFDDSSDIFELFEVGLANSHILVTNHLDTPKLPIFEQWRPDWIFFTDF